MLIANTLAVAADNIFAQPASSLQSSVAWLGAICYTFQIYFDFSGYSDMAIGLGKMIGFNFLENFKHPYISTSMTEFWRRWHISLSSWFRDYVYIPLGGSRRGNRYLNLLVVWFLTGLWHGASWNFIIWGLWNCAFLMIEKRLLGSPFYQKIPAVLRWVGTMLVVLLGWVMFRVETLQEGIEYVKIMLCMVRPINTAYTVQWFLNGKLIFILMTAVLASIDWKEVLGWKNDEIQTVRIVLLDLASIILLVFGIILCMTSTYNPFIYFRF